MKKIYFIKTYINEEKHISHRMTFNEMIKWKRVNEKNKVCASYYKIIANNDWEEIA